MSTNFYVRHIPTESEYQEMQKLLVEKQYEKLTDYIAETTKSYHIGKRSAGWQFLFAPHVKLRKGFNNSNKIVSPWENTLASIKKYLNRKDVEIYDEYGDTFTPEEFWNNEIGASLYNDSEKFINGKQYEKKIHEPIWIVSENTEFTTEEGLRFSTDENFS